MGIFDNLASKLHIDGDDDYDDYDDEDVIDEDEDEEPRAKRSFFNTKNKSAREEDDEPYDQGGRASIRPSNRPNGGAQLAPARTNNRMPQAPMGGKQQVRVIKPSSFDQARQITDTLLARRTVILNLEGLDVNTAQRIVDFASGSCYALHGNFMKISHFIIVITPEDVDIAGDITGGRPDAVSGILASAAAQGGMSGMSSMSGMNSMNGMGGMNEGSSNPFVNNTMNMGSAY